MKKLKIMSAILAVIMTFGLCACGKDGGNTPSDNPTAPATTVAPTDTVTTAKPRIEMLKLPVSFFRSLKRFNTI